MDDLIPFGKYKGRRWADVAKSDPSYLEWLAQNMRNADFRRLAQEALTALGSNTLAEAAKAEETPMR